MGTKIWLIFFINWNLEERSHCLASMEKYTPKCKLKMKGHNFFQLKDTAESIKKKKRLKKRRDITGRCCLESSWSTVHRSKDGCLKATGQHKAPAAHCQTCRTHTPQFPALCSAHTLPHRRRDLKPQPSKTASSESQIYPEL